VERSAPKIGIDIGGTKIEIAALDESGAFLIRRRVPTPKQDYAKTVDLIGQLVNGVETELGATCTVGCSIPGAISPATGNIKNAFNSPLNDYPFDKDVASRLGRPIKMVNDANCFAMSEAKDGAAAGAKTVFGVIIGTGCGGGVVVDGRPLTGANAIGGEWGHNSLPWPMPDEIPGLQGTDGKFGTIETFLSGTGFQANHTATTGEQLSAEEIVEHANAGDKNCQTSLELYVNRLARALSSVVNVIDPDVIVLGGGLSNIERLYRDVPILWGEWIFSDRVDTKLVAPVFGDSSGVRGAAWLWDAEFDCA
jgi:fructokinase